jgi:putative phosphoribosyl transferase
MKTALRLKAGDVRLDADTAFPPDPQGVILFAHGSGSSRHSPRNRMVADQLQQAGFATVLADLLTEGEEQVDERTMRLRFDIDMLAERVGAIVDWLSTNDESRRLPIGLFGASTGAAAALVTAARRPGLVRAVVSRGGRPDLAGPALPQVTAPFLLIVGDQDHPVVELNLTAAQQIGGVCEVRLVRGASHLFAEPGALQQVAELATQWFSRHQAKKPE